MSSVTIEIKDHEYLIHLPRQSYNLRFIQRLLNQASLHKTDANLRAELHDDDMVKSLRNSTEDDQLDHLADK